MMSSVTSHSDFEYCSKCPYLGEGGPKASFYVDIPEMNVNIAIMLLG